ADEERNRHPSEKDAPPLLQLGLRLRDDKRAEGVPLEHDRIRGREVRPVDSWRSELEGLHLAGVEGVLVEERKWELRESGLLAWEDLDPRVIDTRPRRLLQDRRREARCAPRLVDAPDRLLLVELGETLSLTAELRQRAVARVVLEEPHREHGGHGRGDQHPEEKDGRDAVAQRAHRLPRRLGRRPWALRRPC